MEEKNELLKIGILNLGSQQLSTRYNRSVN